MTFPITSSPWSKLCALSCAIQTSWLAIECGLKTFTRQRQLTFPLLMLFVLQQTVKSIQRHLHEFLDELAQGQLFEPVTSGAVTHARAKLKESAFSELNRDCVLAGAL